MDPELILRSALIVLTVVLLFYVIWGGVVLWVSYHDEDTKGRPYMIKFRVTIGIPGYLDAEDELSNLLQSDGEEENFKYVVRDTIQSWVALWMGFSDPYKVKVKIEQE